MLNSTLDLGRDMNSEENYPFLRFSVFQNDYFLTDTKYLHFIDQLHAAMVMKIENNSV